jgi:hypothetical protein
LAQDCYKLFKSVWNQGKADGLSDATAASAAQQAMKGCLDQQSQQYPAASPKIDVPGGVMPDPGPVSPGMDRTSSIGKREK